MLAEGAGSHFIGRSKGESINEQPCAGRYDVSKLHPGACKDDHVRISRDEIALPGLHDTPTLCNGAQHLQPIYGASIDLSCLVDSLQD